MHRKGVRIGAKPNENESHGCHGQWIDPVTKPPPQRAWEQHANPLANARSLENRPDCAWPSKMMSASTCAVHAGCCQAVTKRVAAINFIALDGGASNVL